MIEVVQQEWLERAWDRQHRLTKPKGSLGRLEETGVRIAAIQKTLFPELAAGAVVISAADHGVAKENVSAFPPEVTRQMVANFLSGGAAINQIARSCGASVYVLDVGVFGEAVIHPKLIQAKLRQGSGHIGLEPAMRREEVLSAIEAGKRAAGMAIEQGATMLAAGDMGIGNTTAAAALTAAMLGLEAGAVTGAGSGVQGGAYAHKVEVVRKAVDRAAARLGTLSQADPVDLLSELGGLEIAAGVGVFLAGAEAGIPLVTDGFPVTSAAMLAVRVEPATRGYLFAGHLSQEPGHRLQLEDLGLEPMLNLEMRLGEGTGAVLAFPLLRASAAALKGMATFDEAGVSGA